MSKSRYNPVENEGVNKIGFIVNKELKWIFREQPKDDMGIDAHIEICDNGKPSGRLIALQIKSGKSYFKEKTSEGIVFRGSSEHLEYWSRHSLPVIIAIYDPLSGDVYWQAVLPKYIEKTRKYWKIVVPHSKKLDEKSNTELNNYAQDSPLIEELRKLRFSAYGNYLEQDLHKKLRTILEQIKSKESSTEVEYTRLTTHQVIALESLKRLLVLGISIDILRGLYAWLMRENIISNAIRTVELGYQTFLILGSDGKPAIWTAFDLADYLFIGSEDRKMSDAIICMNEIINMVFETLGYDKKVVKHTLFYTHQENIKEIKLFSEEAIEKELKRLESGESKVLDWDELRDLHKNSPIIKDEGF
jgi:Domain of unknown function (DUF4365)